MRIAVMTIKATDTRCQGDDLRTPVHERRQGQQDQGVAEVQDADQLAAGARRVSSLLSRACPALASAASEPNRRAHDTSLD